MYQFHKNLFSNEAPVFNKSIFNYLKDTNLITLSIDRRELCEGELTEKKVEDALNKVENNKTPVNDGLKKEFFEMF